MFIIEEQAPRKCSRMIVSKGKQDSLMCGRWQWRRRSEVVVAMILVLANLPVRKIASQRMLNGIA